MIVINNTPDFAYLAFRLEEEQATIVGLFDETHEVGVNNIGKLTLLPCSTAFTKPGRRSVFVRNCSATDFNEKDVLVIGDKPIVVASYIPGDSLLVIEAIHKVLDTYYDQERKHYEQVNDVDFSEEEPDYSQMDDDHIFTHLHLLATNFRREMCPLPLVGRN